MSEFEVEEDIEREVFVQFPKENSPVTEVIAMTDINGQSHTVKEIKESLLQRKNFNPQGYLMVILTDGNEVLRPGQSDDINNFSQELIAGCIAFEPI